MTWVISSQLCIIWLVQFLAQWRLISSESAVSYEFSYIITIYWYKHYALKSHELHGMFYMWCQMWQELHEKCVINAPSCKSNKTAVLVILSMRSLVLHQTAEPQEALWHFDAQCGARDCQNCKTVKTAKCVILPEMCQNCQKMWKAQKQHFQG